MALRAIFLVKILYINDKLQLRKQVFGILGGGQRGKVDNLLTYVPPALSVIPFPVPAAAPLICVAGICGPDVAH
jgi:hypothetical protein